ncbi:hypothetical protein HYH03_009877 [Edaphochlamys debaryana]|uniref:Sulfotransferase n=1 Tax=Edaphochlamys debaryana TaxID=47281 RepID=A0A835XXP3_9CHLO|nr:hypothetical protein HYH03_009877 [Edaphochlamys debaryana]|eukprot:KAG2491714.1 hypothetical protein HYH03_009877 [Edaphochlamys debaryana]
MDSRWLWALLLLCLVHISVNSVDVSADSLPIIDFALVGQQKCGTSSLWHYLRKNSDIYPLAGKKETYAFCIDRAAVPRCDNLLQEYIDKTERDRASERAQGRRVYLGDFTSTHFACPCCPATLKLLNPGLKVIIMLRDPVFRAHSRFVEQVQFRTLNHTQPGQPPGFNARANTTSFAAYVDWVVGQTEACLQRARAREGALARRLTMECYMRDHVIGFSVYDSFVLNYLEHFPDKQVLVVYMEDLAAEPLRVLAQVEAHIGVPHFPYSADDVGTVFNAHGAYGWGHALNSSHPRKGGLEWASTPADSNATAVLAAVERLRRFFAPSVQRLFALADEGRITRVPQAWRAIYGKSAMLGGNPLAALLSAKG